ncbi:hypothetical protein K8I85_15230 [bacterium]|nr:hypothetical protein [bacterium]
MKRSLLIVPLLLLTASAAFAGEDRHASSAATYEHLATAIIEIRATEDALVAGILNHHFGAAMQELRDAVSMKMTKPHTEAAAAEITSIANEGGKAVQAIRQRLLQAGHHHHTDAETEDDYIWIDSKEKKGFLDLAGKVARAKDFSTIQGLADELAAMFPAAMKPE